MQTECSTTLFDFAAVEDRKVVASFDGGAMTSNAGALLLGSADRAVRLIERAAGCFVDRRDPRLIEHSVATLVGQRIFGLALGHEDLVDHDALRHDPLFAALAHDADRAVGLLTAHFNKTAELVRAVIRQDAKSN